MKCYLMNKNKKVALIEYNTTLNAISRIYQKIDFEYAPLILSSHQNSKSFNMVKEMNNWFKNRGIPFWRKDLEELLKRLNIETTEELLDKAYGLSLSDQYWINPEKEQLKWEDINFFTNDFKYKAFLEASLLDSNSEGEVSLMTPNNTTDGMLQKAWIIENGKRKLVKGTFHITAQEPLNEWLASQICRRLGFDYCNYEIDIIQGKIVSKCECFINQNQEIVTAYEILESKKKDNNTSEYEHYLNILKENGISNAREQFENMLILDFLVMNYDRHTRNYGIIRNVESLEWEKITPIFDTGEAMQNNQTLLQMNFSNGTGKFFSNTEKKLSDYLEIIQNIQRFNLSKLSGLVEEWNEQLKKYQIYTSMESERIDKLTKGLQQRIDLLKKKQNT